MSPPGRPNIAHAAPTPTEFGIVCVVDFLNLVVRAFHAGAPSRIHAVRGLIDTVRGILTRLSPEYLIFALDGGHAERSRMLPSYKAHRPPKPAELAEQIELAEQALQAIGWPTIRMRDWEADDVAASIVHQVGPVAAEVIVCSSDKDLLQLIPRASIYRPWGGGTTVTSKTVREEYGVEASQIVDYLALCGDTSDGVPGVEGIGEKTAAKLLAEHASLEVLLEKARCLLIPGANGKRLREQADGARLSQRLVRLQGELPIGRHWIHFPVRSPRAGWADRLRDLGLVSAAQRLADVLPAGVDHAGSSHADLEWIVIKSFEPGITEPAISITETTGAIADPAADISTDMSADSNRQVAREIYDQAVAARIQYGKPCGCGYHVGTLLRAAWDAGTAGTPFEAIDPAAFDQHGKPLKARPATRETTTTTSAEATTASRPRGTLF